MAKFYENIEVQGTISATTLYGDGSNLTGISGGSSFTGGTVTGSTTFINGLTSNTISATTYQNLPITGTTDTFPKFTSSNSLGNSLLSESSSTLTFNTTLINNGLTLVLDTSVSNGALVSYRGGGFTYFDTGFNSSQNFRIGSWDGTGGFNGPVLEIPKNTKRILLNGVTDDGSSELQVNGTIKVNTISATTYQNLPAGGSTFTGGTVNGSTNFTNGLTANTISATTYQNLPSVIQISCSDEVTALTTGTTTTFRMPYNMILTEVRGSLTTAQVSGNTFTVNVLNSGTTILSTLLTIDNTQKTSKALGTTQPVISTPNLIDDDEISVVITQIGNGTARGLKVTLIGNRLN